MRPGESWPPELKDQARALFQADGVQTAAEATGIPARTIRHWAQTEGWQHPGDQPEDTGKPSDLRVTPVAHALHPAGKGGKATVTALGYGYQRRRLLRQLADEAAGCLEAMGQDRERGRSAAVRNWAWAVGVLLERAELLAKQASPDGVGSQPDGAEVVLRLRELHADLAARKAAGNGHPA